MSRSPTRGPPPPLDFPRPVEARARRRAVAAADEGSGVLETYTVSHDRGGAPDRAFLAVLTPARARVWATTTDPDLMAALETDELLGTRGSVHEGRFAC